MTDKTITYKLKYKFDPDDDNPQTYRSDTRVDIGQIIVLENLDFHCVIDVKELKQDYQLVLSQSAPSAQEAFDVAVQRGFRPKQ